MLRLSRTPAPSLAGIAGRSRSMERCNPAISVFPLGLVCLDHSATIVCELTAWRYPLGRRFTPTPGLDTLA